MSKPERFPFLERVDRFGTPEFTPYLPLTLSYKNQSLNVLGLLDTGASVNVLPYQMGLDLGAVWEEQTVSVSLAGNLTPVKAKGLVVSAVVREFTSIRLVFAWAESNDMPLLLGQMNFF